MSIPESYGTSNKIVQSPTTSLSISDQKPHSLHTIGNIFWMHLKWWKFAFLRMWDNYCWTPSASGGGWCLLVAFLGSPCDLISSHPKSQQQTLFGHTFTFLAFLGATPSLKTNKVAWLVPFGDIYLLQLLWHSCASCSCFDAWTLSYLDVYQVILLSLQIFLLSFNFENLCYDKQCGDLQKKFE